MKVLIATPAYQKQVNSEFTLSLLRATEYLRKSNHSVNWYSPSSTNLAFNRNLAADKATREWYDWLLFWDGDISVEEPDFIEKMVDLAYSRNADIVGLPVVLKGEPKTLNCARMVEGKYVNLIPPLADSVDVDVIGTGVMLIWANLLRRLEPPHFTFTDTFTDGEPGVFPEDWNFCERASHFTKIVVDPRFHVKHWGIKAFQQ